MSAISLRQRRKAHAAFPAPSSNSAAFRKPCLKRPARNAGFIEDETPEASPADLAHYDGIIFGTPTRFGMMAGQMKQFLDQAGGLWAQNALVGKVAAVFASTGSQHGGHEATLLSTQIPLMHFGMLIAGLPYSFAGQTARDGIIGGAPYGAGTIAGADGALPAHRNRPRRRPLSRSACGPGLHLVLRPALRTAMSPDACPFCQLLTFDRRVCLMKRWTTIISGTAVRFKNASRCL